MIIPKTTSPVIMNWFLALRRSEIAVRQVIWNVIDALPLPVATKQRIAPYVQRENAQAQFVAIRSARAVLMGQTVNSSNPVVPVVMPATHEKFVVDSLLDPQAPSKMPATAKPRAICTLFVTFMCFDMRPVNPMQMSR